MRIAYHGKFVKMPSYRKEGFPHTARMRGKDREKNRLRYTGGCVKIDSKKFLGFGGQFAAKEREGHVQIIACDGGL